MNKTNVTGCQGRITLDVDVTCSIELSNMICLNICVKKQELVIYRRVALDHQIVALLDLNEIRFLTGGQVRDEEHERHLHGMVPVLLGRQTDQRLGLIGVSPDLVDVGDFVYGERDLTDELLERRFR